MGVHGSVGVGGNARGGGRRTSSTTRCHRVCEVCVSNFFQPARATSPWNVLWSPSAGPPSKGRRCRRQRAHGRDSEQLEQEQRRYLHLAEATPRHATRDVDALFYERRPPSFPPVFTSAPAPRSAATTDSSVGACVSGSVRCVRTRRRAGSLARLL
jgi:hypothetical protein